jgi:hypothetical protein
MPALAVPRSDRVVHLAGLCQDHFLMDQGKAVRRMRRRRAHKRSVMRLLQWRRIPHRSLTYIMAHDAFG